ncbi:MAG: low molecular weight protein-tyrosine-phosphatase [Bacteroidales bacterium]
MNIVTVCLGNICRSPMAEGILRKKIQERGLDIRLDSAGTAPYHIGEAPDERAQQTLLEKGINISDLRGRQFEVSDFDRFDLILPMDEDNYNNVIELARSKADKAKVTMLMKYLYPEENISVPDPYFGGPEGFCKVYEMLDAATDKVLESLKI